MADKTIGELPSIANVSDQSLIPVEQSGIAGKMTGAQFKQWAVAGAAPYAQTASEAAAAAAAKAGESSGSADAAAQSAAEAAQSAIDAEDAQEAIENMTVTSETLAAGEEASVSKSVGPGGAVTLAFGIPRGYNGATVSADGIYGFTINDSGHLILTYAGETAPDYYINAAGHLIASV